MVECDAIMSTYKEEWYSYYFSCIHCGNSFISTERPRYCPSCGHTINMIKQGKIIVSNWEGGESNIQNNTYHGS